MENPNFVGWDQRAGTMSGTMFPWSWSWSASRPTNGFAFQSGGPSLADSALAPSGSANAACLPWQQISREFPSGTANRP